MDTSASKMFSFNFKQILLEEIALDGLNGILPEKLLKHIEKRISRPLTGKIKALLWKIALNCEDVDFYKIPKPRESIELLDRFTIVDEESGNLLSPDVPLDGPYEYCPVKGDQGSCPDYDQRMLIPKNKPEVQSLEEVSISYGNSLVLVASLKERCRALGPHKDYNQVASLTPAQFCTLELIGRARDNGQVTVGLHTNLLKIMKDAKSLFYNRRTLEKLGLVQSVLTTQYYSGRGVTSILLRLNRFHQPRFLSTPKVGKLALIVNHLKRKPDFCDQYNVLLKNNIIDSSRNKKIKKLNIVKIEDVVTSPSAEVPTCSHKPRKNPRCTRYIRLNTDSDREDDDEEEAAEPVASQYRVGISIHRQAYERFLEAGLRGLTLQDLCFLLRVGYYAARRIIRVFRARNIIREGTQDGKGYNASPRFLAIAALAKDTKYDHEMQTLLEYYKNVHQPVTTEPDVTPAKRPRLDQDEDETEDFEPTVKEEDAIVERKVFDDPAPSLIVNSNAKKRPTLRQLQFANGILRLTRENMAVSGYQAISQQIANQLGTNLMDRKPVKRMVERLALDGQVRLFNIKWPQEDKHAELICSPSVNLDHPILKAKYREMYIRSLCADKRSKPAQPQHKQYKVQNNYAYKRYTRVRKLHEFLFNLVYGEGSCTKNDLPQGFTSLLEIIPEMTVGLAIGILQKYQGSDICSLRLEDILETKLKDSPQNVFQCIFASKNLRATLVNTMTILATFGLVQLCNRTYKPASIANSHLIKYSFYINKNAKLIDTRGQWPRDEAVEKLSFRFENNEDVVKYWNSLFEIAVNTKVRSRPFNMNKFIIPKAPVFDESGAESRDDGRIVSDGLGAAGLHSAYYIENEYHWVASLTKPAAPPPKTKLTKLKIKMVKAKRARKPPAKKKLVEFKERRPKGSRVRVNLHWTEYDDEIILLCRAAVMITAPRPQPGCYTIRNTVARDLIADPLKTVHFCHRRSAARRNQVAIDQLVAEFKKRKDFPKYHDLLTKLRRKNSNNMTKIIQEARLPTMELVWLLYQIRRSDSFNREIPCVAIDHESLVQRYDIEAKASPKQYDFYKSHNATPELNTLKESIMMTLFLTSDESQVSVNTCVELYKFMATKNEELLRTAVADLRRSGVIVCVKKHLLHQNFKSDTWHEVMESSSFGSIKAFGIARSCQRKMNVRMTSEFADDVAGRLDEDIQHNADGSPEVNCVLFEAVAAGNIGVATQNVPVVTGTDNLRDEKMNEIDEESEFRIRPGNVVLLNKKGVKKMAELYPLPDFEVVFADLIGQSTIEPPKKQDSSKEDPVIAFLLNRKGEGCTFKDLQKTWTGDAKSLIAKLEQFESKNIIKRVGYFDNILILTQFQDDWSILFSDHRIIPTPWIKEDIKLNKQLFVKLCGAVLNRLFENPGKSIAQLAIDCDCIASRNIQSICTFLLTIQCVTMKTIVYTEPDLFSEDVEPFLVDYNKYASHKSIAVFPVNDAISKFAASRIAILSADDES